MGEFSGCRPEVSFIEFPQNPAVPFIVYPIDPAVPSERKRDWSMMTRGLG